MWVLEFKGRVYTCPKNSLYALALLHQLDNKITHGNIHDDESAKVILENKGFTINWIDDVELTEVPKYADFYNRQHWDLYEKLINKPDSELTKEQRDFCTRMYHAEEYACGLDGDR